MKTYYFKISENEIIKVKKSHYDLWVKAKTNNDALVEFTFKGDDYPFESLVFDPHDIESVKVVSEKQEKKLEKMRVESNELAESQKEEIEKHQKLQEESIKEQRAKREKENREKEKEALIEKERQDLLYTAQLLAARRAAKPWYMKILA